MPRRRGPALLLLTFLVVLPAPPARGADDVAKVKTLLRDVDGADFDKANVAVEQLARYRGQRSISSPTSRTPRPWPTW
jgi:hypothetical protein